MTESVTLARQLTLQSWMSAAFPIGAFSYSHGIETAIQDGRLKDTATCQAWIHSIITHGSGWNDSVILCHAHRRAASGQLIVTDDSLDDTALDRSRKLSDGLCKLNDLALGLQAGAERLKETIQLGSAFRNAAVAWGESDRIPWQGIGQDLSFPVVVGVLGAAHGIPATLLAASTLQSTASNLAWIATRLVPLGQNQCLKMIADLGATIEQIADNAARASLDDLGGCALLADLASLQHEQLPGRVCQT
jgi:urease accessory protein